MIFWILFDSDIIAQKLTPDLLCRIHDKEKRAKYERLGKILRGETVPFTKWGSKGRIDSLRSILSNKLTALFRSEPKDVVDIHAIAL